MTDLVEKSFYDESTDSLIVKTSYDNRAVLAQNNAQRNAAPETGRYKGNLVHIARVHLGDLQRLKNAGFNLLSPDPEEVKRALLHLQAEEKALMTMPGKPIGKKKTRWM